MFHAFIKSDNNINMKLKDWCIEHYDEITKVKDVFKPADDCIDSVMIMKVIKIKFDNEMKYYAKKVIENKKFDENNE